MINKNIMILFSNNNHYENDKILGMLGPVIYIVKILLKNIKNIFLLRSCFQGLVFSNK